jgi:peptidoglycan/xylan/chitin deacetylase (PgdA/CDA1 family)
VRAARTVAAAAARSTAFGHVVRLLERADSQPAGVVPVLMYHRVDEPAAGMDPALISATPDEFAAQVEYIAEHRRPLSLEELLELRRGSLTPPRGAVVMTFDDAYRDFAEHAWPALRRCGVPATLCVPTAYPGHPERSFWWDRMQRVLEASRGSGAVATPAGRLSLRNSAEQAAAARALRRWIERSSHDEALAALDAMEERSGVAPGEPRATILDWDELRSLAAEGVALVAHSRTHPRLDRLPLARAREEVIGSVEDLEQELGAAPPVFAYPGGGYTDALVSWMETAGFELAFTTARGGNDLRRADWLRLRRINVGRRSSVPLLRAQLLSWPARLGSARVALERA